MTTSLATKIGNLFYLEDGWFDGQGKAPDSESLDFVLKMTNAHFPKNLEVPAVVPTPEGDILLEWSTRWNPSLDIYLSQMKGHFHMNGPIDETEKEFDLSKEETWKELGKFLALSIQK